MSGHDPIKQAENSNGASFRGIGQSSSWHLGDSYVHPHTRCAEQRFGDACVAFALILYLTVFFPRDCFVCVFSWALAFVSTCLAIGVCFFFAGGPGESATGTSAGPSQSAQQHHDLEAAQMAKEKAQNSPRHVDPSVPASKY